MTTERDAEGRVITQDDRNGWNVCVNNSCRTCPRKERCDEDV